MIPPPRWRQALIWAKRLADLGNATLPQLVLAELMESGRLERHLRQVRRRHRERRNAMVEAIEARLPGSRIHGAAAGLHLLVTLAEPFSDLEVAAAALERGVKVQPLSWHSERPGPPGLLLGYAARTPDEIADGVATLAAAVRATARRSAAAGPPPASRGASGPRGPGRSGR
jgi:GntR family transcriptional regulator/MocR family aminotransferase